MEEFDPVAIIATAIDRMAFGSSDLHGPDPEAAADVRAILSLLKGGQEEEAAQYAFDPNEPRDPAGKWTAGGGSGGKADAPASHGEGEPKERHGRLKAALESAKGWLTPSGIARKARALAHGVRHPVESLQAGREKVKGLVKKYGVSGALVIVGGYTAYYTLAAMNPGILKFPVPLTPTLLTTAKLAGQLEARLRGQPAEPVHHAREEALDVETALEEVKALVAALGGVGAEIDEAVMRAVLGEMLGQS